MLILLVALAQSLFYLASVPVCAAFCLSARGGLRLGVGVSIFERRFALRRARRLDTLDKKPKKRGDARIWRLLRRLRCMGLGLRGRLGLGDAAATALACGALRGLTAALGGRARRVEIDIAPVFCDSEVVVELSGMIRASAGQIITAIASIGIDDINRRIGKWKGIPSKAS